MDDPLVTIYVPTFEPNPTFLKEALDCVQHQTEQRFIVLINDDASEAPVREMVEPYLRDPRFTFRRNTKRRGIGGNWNACLEHFLCPTSYPSASSRRRPFGHELTAEWPTTNYIQFLFQDDRWYFTYLSSMLAIFQKYPETGLAAADHEYDIESNLVTAPVYEDLRRIRNSLVAPGFHRGQEFLQFWIQRELHPNLVGEPSFIMLRRSTVEHIGPFREDMPQYLDVEYWTRALLTTHWYSVGEELGIFRVHRCGASAQNAQSGEGLFDRLRCFELLLSSLPYGNLRNEVTAARRSALITMVRKFLRRIAAKQGVITRRGNLLWKFALRHPFMMCKAIVSALLQH